MLQLGEKRKLIEKHYADTYKDSGYFAAVGTGVVFGMAVDGKETGKSVL